MSRYKVKISGRYGFEKEKAKHTTLTVCGYCMGVAHHLFRAASFHQDAIPRDLNGLIEVDMHWVHERIHEHSPTPGRPVTESGKRQEARSMSSVEAVWRRAPAEPGGMGTCSIDLELSTQLPLYLLYESCARVESPRALLMLSRMHLDLSLPSISTTS
jgi:hypothetical protein